MKSKTTVEILTKEQLTAYLVRINYPGNVSALKPNVDTLFLLHQLHTLHVPFEDLTLHLDPMHDRTQPLDISMDAVFNKIVTRNRGGYCFEMNKLFASALVSLGFDVYSHKAGVIWGSAVKRSPAHRMLTVKINEELYLADVGFGGPGQISPLKLTADELQMQGSHQYKLVLDLDGEFELNKIVNGRNQRLYAFNPEITYREEDYNEINRYTSMDPESTFVTTLMCTMPLKTGRLSLVGDTFKEIKIVDGQETATTHLKSLSYSEQLEILKTRFNVYIPGITPEKKMITSYDQHYQKQGESSKKQNISSDLLTGVLHTRCNP